MTVSVRAGTPHEALICMPSGHSPVPWERPSMLNPCYAYHAADHSPFRP